MTSELTRPIIGIENRTPLEVFDIMCDRIRHGLNTAGDDVIERVARAIEQPFLPHGYELKPHLLKAAAIAAIKATEEKAK